VLVFPAGTGAGQVASGASAGLPPGVVDALRNGNKIEAIRLYREVMKCSLLDAKNTVDALEKKLGNAH
jgi:ribosomal protein L7/L12